MKAKKLEPSHSPSRPAEPPSPEAVPKPASSPISKLSPQKQPKKAQPPKSSKFKAPWPVPQWTPINVPNLKPRAQPTSDTAVGQDDSLGFSDETIQEVAGGKRIGLRLDQVRAIRLWMKRHRARSIGMHPDAFKELLALLSFDESHYSEKVRHALRDKARDRCRREGVKMEASGAIMVSDRKEPYESTCFAVWTDDWLADDWDGSIEKPVNWDTEFADRRALVEAPLCQMEEIVEAEIFDVEGPPEEVFRSIETTAKSQKGRSLPDLYTDSDPRTVRTGNGPIGVGGDKEDEEGDELEENDDGYDCSNAEGCEKSRDKAHTHRGGADSDVDKDRG